MSSYPQLAKQKAKIPPKSLQTSRSLQTPAINRPLIGGCNRIQFISRSDGLTFIITRGSTCHELWAIHSLVEINCITSAQYCVLRTRHTDGQQLLASAAGDQLPTASARDLLQGATRLIGLDRNSHVCKSFLEVLCKGPESRLPGRVSISPAEDQPKALLPCSITGHPARCRSSHPALAWIHHSGFRGNYRTQWGLGGAIWALLLLLSSSH